MRLRTGLKSVSEDDAEDFSEGCGVCACFGSMEEKRWKL